ncbi:MAG: transposase [Pirellula sp.]|jgi:REP element-mobilizing transposase RayT
MIDRDPIAYFLTYTTYGTWLHGRDQGSVDRTHNVYSEIRLEPNKQRLEAMSQRCAYPRYQLDATRRYIVLETIKNVVLHRNWVLFAAHIRSNHIHALIRANTTPEKVLVDLKAWSSRQLIEALNEPKELKRWTRHGSTLYLWTEDQLADKLKYVIQDQGEPMELYVNPIVKLPKSEPRV